MTRAAFLDWASAQDGRYEFDGLAPVAMTGGTNSHNRLQRRVMRLLEDRLSGTPCEPFGPDLGVETVGETIRYPDAFVACSPVDGPKRIASGVTVVFEVLSRGSSRTDRIVKVREYQAVASIRRYVIIEQDSIGATVFERPDDGAWQVAVLTGEDVLAMPEIGVSFSLTELYAGIDLVAEDPASPA
jgi:Uma2 family endonuclease